MQFGPDTNYVFIIVSIVGRPGDRQTVRSGGGQCGGGDGGGGVGSGAGGGQTGGLAALAAGPPRQRYTQSCVDHSGAGSAQATAGCCWRGRRTSAGRAPGRGSSAATWQRSSTASCTRPGTAPPPTALTVVTRLGRVLPASISPLPSLRTARAAVRALGLECKRFRHRPVIYFTGEGRPGTGDWGFRYMGRVVLVGFRTL